VESTCYSTSGAFLSHTFFDGVSVVSGLSEATEGCSEKLKSLDMDFLDRIYLQNVKMRERC